MRHVAGEPIAYHGKPLTEPVFFILLSLAGKPLHGYGLMKDIESLSKGRLQITTGTLYGAIKRLLEDAWIKPFAQEDSSRDKQAYAITAAGRKQLKAEIQRLKSMTATASVLLREA